ncbi:MAG: DUF1570 domain-containing protein [Pirellulales bacterium]|nr:DUF1570 domain-containing protein [Pirellulales bacterium]
MKIISIAELALVLLPLVAPRAGAMDRIAFKRDGKEREIAGRLLVEAQDGGLLLLERDGVLWAVPPEEKIKHTSDDAPFKPFTRDELAKKILAELPPNFDVLKTAHYLIFYDTSKAYAGWCGSLFERLYLAFTNFWTRKGFTLKEPEFPLVAIVFADRAAYLKFSKSELGDAGEAIVGYYSLTSNRMTMYDLSGVENGGGPRGRGSTMAQINQILAQPQALQTVATIVHEATHQIAFNCGLHTRLADCPLWFSEGIALYFETPDLRSAKGWSGIGAVNYLRLDRFQENLRRRPADSLETLISTDKRFRDTKTGLDAYAEAWALTYFLLRQKPKEYIAYLKLLSEKKPLLTDAPEKRIEEFEKIFGSRRKFDEEFIRYMGRLN